eukprot:gene8642-16847_t
MSGALTDEAARGAGAVVSPVSGDRFYASLNGAKLKTGHRLAGTRLAWALAKLLPPPTREREGCDHAASDNDAASLAAQPRRRPSDAAAGDPPAARAVTCFAFKGAARRPSAAGRPACLPIVARDPPAGRAEKGPAPLPSKREERRRRSEETPAKRRGVSKAKRRRRSEETPAKREKRLKAKRRGVSRAKRRRRGAARSGQSTLVPGADPAVLCDGSLAHCPDVCADEDLDRFR